MTIHRALTSQPRGAAVLNADRTKAIWRAALIELARVGYDRLSMDAVARRAGVGKAALYRRWQGKEAMVAAMILAIDIEVVTAHDCGNIEDDVFSYLEQGFRLLRRPLAARLLPQFYAEISRDTELSMAIQKTVLCRKRESIALLVQRGIERGELSATTDVDTAFDLIVGPIYWRSTIVRLPTSDDDIRRAARAIASALKCCDKKIDTFSELESSDVAGG